MGNDFTAFPPDGPSVAVDLKAAAFVAKTMGDENRLRILLLLRQGRQSVSAIVEQLGISQPLVSHHLKELRRGLLVAVERQGPFVYYELADERIMTILDQIGELAAHLLSRRQLFRFI